MANLKKLSSERKLKNAAAHKAKAAADAAAAADATAVAAAAASAAYAAAATATDAASRAAAGAIAPVARLLITVLKGYCFRGQIHSIPGYWSIPQYSWSNLFQFSSCRGSKNRYCFQHEDSNIYYCFHRNYCVTVFLSIGQYSSVFLSITVYVCRNSV